MPFIYPLTFLFPLHMGIIAHRNFPLLYLKMLHVRDHILQHRIVDAGEQMDISCCIAGQRIIPKGIEFDIHTFMKSEGTTVWESISTNFFPGSFGDPQKPSPLSRFEPMPDDCCITHWTMPKGAGFRFGLPTGDYNGIHYHASYARKGGAHEDHRTDLHP